MGPNVGANFIFVDMLCGLDAEFWNERGTKNAPGNVLAYLKHVSEVSLMLREAERVHPKILNDRVSCLAAGHSTGSFGWLGALTTLRLSHEPRQNSMPSFRYGKLQRS